jgi:hypothetical protein
MDTFEKNLRLIGVITTLSETLASSGRTSTTLAEIAERLRRSFNEIVSIFGLLGIVPRSWDDPSSYLLSDIIESGTIHEVAARY